MNTARFAASVALTIGLTACSFGTVSDSAVESTSDCVAAVELMASEGDVELEREGIS